MDIRHDAQIRFIKGSLAWRAGGTSGVFFSCNAALGVDTHILVPAVGGVVLWLSSVTLEKKAEFAAVFRPMRLDLVLSVLGALALIAGCALWFREGGMLVRLLCVLGIVSALGLLAACVFRLKGNFCRFFCAGNFLLCDPAVL